MPDFIRADLRGSRFERADLSGAEFRARPDRGPAPWCRRPHRARLAGRVLDQCQRNGVGGFDLAYGYEALVRASAVAGDAGRAREYTDRALAAAGDIADADDRDLVLADLETIPGQPRYW